ncbi:hypothetical protein M885DRAFT_535444 [Pelagophyceae sp. CCMP2097]|nr:hypothetical protein M885DRAFT_535444 [Pelagophyceae sp. CCMP2097]
MAARTDDESWGAPHGAAEAILAFRVNAAAPATKRGAKASGASLVAALASVAAASAAAARQAPAAHHSSTARLLAAAAAAAAGDASFECDARQSSSDVSAHSRDADDADADVDGENESPSSDRRRSDRNAREQRRSHLISEQVNELRALLEAAGVQPKQSKFSVLASTATHIRKLQRRNDLLEAEKKKWLAQAKQPAARSRVDYGAVFQSSSSALAVCALDGRFVECNACFSQRSGYAPAELRQLTLFNLTDAADIQQTYGLISGLLKQSARECDIRAVLRHPVQGAKIALSLVYDASTEDRFEAFLVTLVESPPFPGIAS